MASKMLRWFGIVVASVLVLVIAIILAGRVVSGRRIAKVHAASASREISIPADSAAVARGEHLVRAVSGCVGCHGEDLSGTVMIDVKPLGRVAAANLTRGKGGIAAGRTDADLARALHRGVRPDGTSLWIMPSEAYVHMSAEDIGAVVAYLRQLPAADHELPANELRYVGRVLLMLGKLPLLSAELTPDAPYPPAIPPDTTAAYGRYLANIGGCTGCHGPSLSGQAAGGGPDMPPSSNITPTGIGSWSQADFVRALREGKRPSGVPINEAMPWKVFGKMTDQELQALWAYLRTVPPKEFTAR
ncbi:MAG: cytochrome c [Gemmatimonadales bacterium]|nr:cytochrome c [Gemmatimonadales bacterium]